MLRQFSLSWSSFSLWKGVAGFSRSQTSAVVKLSSFQCLIVPLVLQTCCRFLVNVNMAKIMNKAVSVSILKFPVF